MCATSVNCIGAVRRGISCPPEPVSLLCQDIKDAAGSNLPLIVSRSVGPTPVYSLLGTKKITHITYTPDYPLSLLFLFLSNYQLFNWDVPDDALAQNENNFKLRSSNRGRGWSPGKVTHIYARLAHTSARVI